MKLSCAEAASVCTKAEYKEAGFLEKLRLKLHLFFCKACKNYHANNHKLTLLIKKADIQPCSQQQKQIFKQQMREGNSKTSEN